MDRHQQITRQRDQRDFELDIGGHPDADHDQHGGKAIAAVIEEIAVARALDLAEAGETAIERITEPVNEISQNRQPQPVGVQIAAKIAPEHEQRAKHTGEGEHIRGYPGRHHSAQMVERTPLKPRDQIFLNAVDWGHGCLGIGGVCHKFATRPVTELPPLCPTLLANCRRGKATGVQK